MNSVTPLRRILLVRHAKSSWADPQLTDHDRPLNARGRRVAPAMAQVLRNKGWRPSVILHSTATRASATAEAMRTALFQKDGTPELLATSELYHASVSTHWELARGLDDAWTEVMLVGHNPGLQDWLESACHGTSPARFPTCAVAVISFQATSWTRVQTGEGRCDELLLPKALGL